MLEVEARIFAYRASRLSRALERAFDEGDNPENSQSKDIKEDERTAWSIRGRAASN